MTSEIVCFHRYWNSAFPTPRCPLNYRKIGHEYSVMNLPKISREICGILDLVQKYIKNTRKNMKQTLNKLQIRGTGEANDK